MLFVMGRPYLQIKPSLYVCKRVQRSQIFKWNLIILICSRVIAFLVICCPNIVPVIPMSSQHRPCCPHIVPTPPYALWSPCCLCGPHIVSVISTSSRWLPHHPCISIYPPHQAPTLRGMGGPDSVKIQ